MPLTSAKSEQIAYNVRTRTLIVAAGKASMTFGSNLQRLREKSGLSQSGLARKAGISVKTLQNWEIDRALPRLDFVVMLAEGLGVPVEQLTAGLTTKKPAKKGKRKK